MNKKLVLIPFFILTWFNHIHAQEWQRYSDSIYSNLQKNNISKTEVFLNLANEHINNTTVVKDTIYADFLYRSGCVKYNLDKNPTKDYYEALNIWENSKIKNQTKIMKLHYFLGRFHFLIKEYKIATKNFKKCYSINKKKQLSFSSNYNHSISFLMLLHYKNKNYKKAKYYALRYIKFNEDKAYDEFNFYFPKAFGYARDITNQEKTLLSYLANYQKQQLNKPELLFQIHSELMSFYGTTENDLKAIFYGERALLCIKNHNKNHDTDKSLVYISLIAYYSQIGDNINVRKFEHLLNLYYPANDETDYYQILNFMIIDKRYDDFKEKFLLFEKELIAQNNFNELIHIYSISLTLFEQNSLFDKKTIEEQINTLIKHREFLTDENKLFFEGLLAEYSFFNQEYLKSLNICNKNLKLADKELKLEFYRYKTLSEKILNIPSAKKSGQNTLLLAKKLYGENNPAILQYLLLPLDINYYGNDYKSTKNAVKALKIIYTHQLENTDVGARLWVILAQESFSIGNNDDAIVYYKKALKIYTKRKPLLYFNCLIGLSKASLYKGDYPSSLEYIEKSKPVLEKIHIMKNIAKASYFSSLGDYYLLQNDFIKAKYSYEKGYEFYGTVYSKNQSLNYILCNYFIHNNVTKTLQILEEHYKNNNSTQAQKLIYLLKYNTKKNKEARELLLKSLTSVISQNNSYFHLLSDSEREVIYTGFTDQFEFLNTHLLLTPDKPFLKQYVNLRFYFKSLLFFNTSKNSPKDKTSIENYQELKSNTVLLNTYYEQEGNYSKEIDELLHKNRELEKFLSQSKNTVKTPTLKEAQNSLQKNEAYVEIIRINKQSRSATKDKLNILNKFTDSIYYGALIIKPTGNPKFVLIDSTNTLEGTYLKNYQQYINGKQKFKKDSVSHTLFFKPIETYLNNIDTVYLVSDGIYNSINVETFYNPERKNYVIDYLNIKPILSIRSIVNKSKIITAKRELTATIIGNPEFELTNYTYPTKEALAINDLSVVNLKRNNTSSIISYLPGTEKEINSVERILSRNKWNTKAYQLEDASEDHLKAVKSPRVLHIATHGYFINNEKQPHSTKKHFGVQENYFQTNSLLKSGLLFTGAQNTLDGKKINSESNGILTAQEAKQLDLKNTELVVLSACETGLGNNVIGEGVYGLQRAFMIGGAQSIIMSLWSVNDSTTEELMTNFYTFWIEHKIPKREAFKKAKLKLKETYPEPFYWAPFILIE